MKTLETNSIRTGKTDGEMVGIDILSKILARTHKRGARFLRQSISFNPRNPKSRAGSVNRVLSMEPESPAATATIRQAASFPEGNENRHAVRLARNLRSGSDDSGGFDRHLCRSLFFGRCRSGAAVRLHGRFRGIGAALPQG